MAEICSHNRKNQAQHNYNHICIILKNVRSVEEVRFLKTSLEDATFVILDLLTQQVFIFLKQSMFQKYEGQG